MENLKTHQSKTRQDPERLSFQRVVVTEGRAFLGMAGSWGREVVQPLSQMEKGSSSAGRG